MITLYGSGSPNVLRVAILLEELGLPHRLVPVDIFRGEQFEPDFLALNPNAKVPVLVDEDGPDSAPVTIFESAAILVYLAEKTGQFMPTDSRARYDVLQWLLVQVTTTGPMIGQLVHFTRYAPPLESSYSRDRYRSQAERVYEVMDRRLDIHPYLCGQDLTVADFALFPWTTGLEAYLGSDGAQFPALLRWRELIRGRPAVKRASAAIAELRSVLTTADTADPRVVARVFGRLA